MLKKLLSKINAPLPGWLTILLLCGGIASAAVPLYTGSVSVPSAGSFTNNASTTALAATGSNTLTSNTTGALDAFIFNTINGTPPTGKLVNFKAGGTSEFSSDMSGNVKANSYGDFGNVQTAGALVTGGLGLGTKGVNLNGFMFEWGNTGVGAGYASLVGSGSVAVATVTDSELGIVGGSIGNTPQLALSNAGNLGVALGVYTAGGSGTTQFGGACSAAGNFSVCSSSGHDYLVPETSGRPIAATNAAFTNINFVLPDGGGVQTVDSSGGTLSYVPPVFTTSGAVVASTVHIVQGTNTVGGGSCAADSTNCTLSSNSLAFSGAAVFASSSSYQCFIAQQNGVPLPGAVLPSSGSAAQIVFGNPYSSSVNITGYTVAWTCIGT